MSENFFSTFIYVQEDVSRQGRFSVFVIAPLSPAHGTRQVHLVCSNKESVRMGECLPPGKEIGGWMVLLMLPYSSRSVSSGLPFSPRGE